MKRKAVYALSCLIRGFPYGQKEFLEIGGLEVFRKILDSNDPKDFPVQVKVSIDRNILDKLLAVLFGNIFLVTR